MKIMKLFFVLTFLWIIQSNAFAERRKVEGCDPAQAAIFGGECPCYDTSAPSDFFACSGGEPSGTPTAPATTPFTPVNPVFDNAESCTDWDMRGSNPLRHMPIQDQANLGTCYAHAGVAIIDSWRFSVDGQTNYSHQSSAEALAVKANARWFLDPFSGEVAETNGGFVCEAVNQARESGTCDNGQIPVGRNRGDVSTMIREVGGLMRQLHGDGTARNPGLLETIYQNSEMIPIINTRQPRALWMTQILTHGPAAVAVAPDSSVARAYRLLTSATAQVALCINHHIPGSINTSSITDLAYLGTQVLRKRMTDRFEAIIDSRCEGHMTNTDDLPNCRATVATSPSQIWGVIQGKIGPGTTVPPAIDFCTSIFRNPRNGLSWRSGGGFSYNDLDGDGDSDCGAHAVAITGRRMNTATGKCQLLIRNSWGAGCGSYSQPPWECSGGYVWIDAETLMSNTYQVEALD